MNLQDVQALDANDPLAHKRSEFLLPADTIYLDGNSLGCLTVAARDRAREVVEQQWGNSLIKSWNAHHWIDLPAHVGEKIAPLIGAAPAQTIACDSVSVNLFKLISAALTMQKGRTVVLSQQDNFPTDLYMVQGLSQLLGEGACELKLVSEENIEANLDESVALLLLTQVNFRTGRIHDMQKLNHLAHEKGVLVLWDLSHSAGVMPIQLDATQTDFAVGCGYKYLNGGPGAPAFVYVASRHMKAIKQPVCGWMGHKAPFHFDPQYVEADCIEKFLVGTPPVISMSVLDAALEIFEDISMQQVRDKSVALSELFLTLVSLQPELKELQLISPQDSRDRGSQLAFSHPHAYAICQALIEKNVIADFRAPNILRFGFSPLILRFADIWHSVEILAELMANETWRDEKFGRVGKVT